MSPALVNVAFPLPLAQLFTYSVSEDLRERLAIGSRVLAPFGSRTMTGFAVSFPEQTNLTHIKEINDVLDPEPIVSAEIQRLCEWISEYYLCSVGEALRLSVPSSLLQATRSMVQALVTASDVAAQTDVLPARQLQLLRYLCKVRKITIPELKRRLGAKGLICALNELQRQGLVKQAQFVAGRPAKPKVEKYVALAHQSAAEFEQRLSSLKKKAPRQAACLALLHTSGTSMLQKELLQQTGASLPTLKALAKGGLVTFSEKTVLRDYYSAIDVAPPARFKLTEEQSAALTEITQALQEGAFATYLIFGVTGSGKTQVYIDVISESLRRGRDAIVLVPEIALTPQMVHRFRSHFRDQVAVLHSAMSEGERYDSWFRIQRGEARVVVGPRSAVFAPVRNLGLIVVDEEHEASYKQADQTPRYHARDLAIVRAKFTDSVIILGSATPSTESFRNAQSGKYRLLRLERRVNDAPLPAVKLIDMIKEKRMSGSREEPVFSRLLTRKITEKIEQDQQVILLLNRRGFSSYIKCKECGHLEQCEHCDISLTYHLRGRRLRCHYCGYSKRAPSVCVKCQGLDILFQGLGTQRVEDELRLKFPQARSVRMDLDTTSRKQSHDRILADFGNGKYNILLGTQMVAKGLDFSRVTLVGVINADIGMLLPDFRSAERTFQLITQVAGRAGRKDLVGEVIIQTYSPDSFCLSCASTHDFQKFYAEEIVDRHALGFPPFGRLICIHFRGEEEPQVEKSASHFARILRARKTSCEVLGPAASPMSKLKNHYRYQVLVKAGKSQHSGSQQARTMVKEAMAFYSKEFSAKGVKVAVDVDPVSIL